MEIEKNKAIIEAILYSAGREVKMTELMSALELGAKEIANIIESMKEDYKNLKTITVEDINEEELTIKNERRKIGFENVLYIYDKVHR